MLIGTLAAYFVRLNEHFSFVYDAQLLAVAGKLDISKA